MVADCTVLLLLVAVASASCTPPRVSTAGGRGSEVVAGAADPAWAPSGELLSFRSDEPGRAWKAEVYVRRLRGHAPDLRVTANHVYDGEPAFAPDGRSLAYTTAAGTEPQIMLADLAAWDPKADDGPPLPIAALTVLGGENPAFAPDGRHLAFTSRRDGAFRIHEIDLATRAVTVLSAGPRAARHLSPAYTSEGSAIAYAGDDAGAGFDLWLVDRESRSTRRLSDLPGDELHPTFTPDGRALVCSHREGEGTDPILLVWRLGDGQIQGPAAPLGLPKRAMLPLLRARFSADGERLAGSFFEDLRWNVAVLHWKGLRMAE